MKKRKILNALVVLGLLTGSIGAWGNEGGPYVVKCASNSFPAGFGSQGFFFPYGFSRSEEVSIGVGIDSVGSTIKGKVFMTTWVAARAEFEYQGKSYVIDYLTYGSPSLAHATIDGEEKMYACQILELNY